MLQNSYFENIFLAKIGFDTAKNEPAKNCKIWPTFLIVSPDAVPRRRDIWAASHPSSKTIKWALHSSRFSGEYLRNVSAFASGCSFVHFRVFLKCRCVNLVSRCPSSRKKVMTLENLVSLRRVDFFRR